MAATLSQCPDNVGEEEPGVELLRRSTTREKMVNAIKYRTHSTLPE
jgi:hypothetical protein